MTVQKTFADDLPFDLEDVSLRSNDGIAPIADPSDELRPVVGDDKPVDDELHAPRHLLVDPKFLNYFIATTPLILATSELGDDVVVQLTADDGTAFLCTLDDPSVLDHANALARRHRPGDLLAFLGKRDLPRLADFCRAHAPHIGRRQPVYKRLAWLPNDGDGSIWLNLGKPDGACVRITNTHWNLEVSARPLFLKNRHQRPLPEPISSPEGLDALQRMLPPMSPPDLKLLIGAMLGMLIPSGMHPSFAYPVLVLTGPPGSPAHTPADQAADARVSTPRLLRAPESRPRGHCRPPARAGTRL